jgi:hypothetical protein
MADKITLGSAGMGGLGGFGNQATAGVVGLSVERQDW